MSDIFYCASSRCHAAFFYIEKTNYLTDFEDLPRFPRQHLVHWTTERQKHVSKWDIIDILITEYMENMSPGSWV